MGSIEMRRELARKPHKCKRCHALVMWVWEDEDPADDGSVEAGQQVFRWIVANKPCGCVFGAGQKTMYPVDAGLASLANLIDEALSDEA